VDNSTKFEDAADLVVARRFAVVDPLGRVRVVMGDLKGNAEGYFPGVALVDEGGHERVSLVLTDIGPLVSFAAEGNVVLELGVADRGNPEVRLPGPFVLLCEPGGEARWGVRVDDEGDVEMIGDV
jgi:hypothetical protein